jgi:DNA-binding CsgD family transcriptional regulator
MVGMYSALRAVATAVNSGSSDTLSFRMRRRSDNPSADVELLTDRQRDILQGIVDGLSNKEIGRRLGISHFTVRNHVSKLLQQLGLPSRILLRRSVGGRKINDSDAQLQHRGDSRHRTKNAGIRAIQSAAEDKRDTALCLAIEKAIAERAEIDITLSVRGTVVSGCIVNGKAYFPELGDAFAFDVAFE